MSREIEFLFMFLHPMVSIKNGTHLRCLDIIQTMSSTMFKMDFTKVRIVFFNHYKVYLFKIYNTAVYHTIAIVLIG
ncbi:unnamed protein product [Debaryomyces tyrocola]|nr:unnamed protein product [Debaryomyces tyrocola]